MAECVYRLEMGRGYTIDRIANLDPHWWGHADAGRFALMAAEDGLLDGDDLQRLWGTTDLGEVRNAIEERADRLATAKGRGEARGLRVVEGHADTVYAEPVYGKEKDTPTHPPPAKVQLKARNQRISDISARVFLAPEDCLSEVEAVLSRYTLPLGGA